MEEPYFSKDLSERQISVIVHYLKNLGITPNDFYYVKSEEYLSDLYPIDIAVFEPVEGFDYYIISTVGLSEYYFTKNFARSELLMIMPSNWKPLLNEEEYNWAPQLLRDIAYAVVEGKQGVTIGQVYLLGEGDGKAYSPYTDAIGGIVTLPENLPIEFYEEKIGETYTRFFQVNPIDSKDLSKLDEMGPKNFIRYELHDSDGPLMVTKLKEKQVQGIDKLVKQNEDALRGND